MRSPITFVAAVAAALVCATSALAAVPLRADGRIPMGFNGSYSLTRIWSDPVGATPWIDAHAAAERAAGATVSRTPLYWDSVEGRQGVRAWATYDRIVKSDWLQGIRPILLISGAPSWASPGCTSTCVPDDAHLADFQSFVQAAAARYGSLITGVEIFNEPDLAWYWGSAADPERYARVLCAGFRGERAAERAGAVHVAVAGGALSGSQTTSKGNIAMPDFLSRLFAAGGGACMDALSFHPYPGSTDLGPGSHFAKVFAQVRARRDAAAPGLPLWVTETGMTLSQPGITESMRAATLPAIYRAVTAMPDVELVVFHTLVQPSGPLNYGLGKIEADAAGAPQFVPTPTYSALQAEVAGGPA